MRVPLKLLEALLRSTDDEAFIASHLPNTTTTPGDVAAARKTIIELIDTLRDVTEQTLPAQQDADPIDATLPLPDPPASVSLDERTQRLKRRTGTKRSEGNPDIADDIDRYASANAWIAHFPGRRTTLIAQTGLTEDAWPAFCNLVEEAMRSDAALRALYDERLKIHLSYIDNG